MSDYNENNPVGSEIQPPSNETDFCCGLSKSTCIGIGAVVIAAIAIGVVAFVLQKRFGKGGKSCGKDTGKKQPGDMTEIYVGNLSYDMTEKQLLEEFKRFGVVHSARIIGHRTSGKSKGYGFVEMPHRKEALVAIKSLNGRDIQGRKLRVNEARSGSRHS